MEWRSLLLLGTLVCVGTGELHAQPNTKPAPLTIPALQKRLKTVQDDGDLSAEAKEKIVDWLQESITRLEIAQEQAEKAVKFEQRMPLITEALQTVQQKLATLPKSDQIAPEIPDDLDELEQSVESREKQIEDPQTGLRKEIADLDAESELRRTRPQELIDEQAEVEERLREIDTTLEELATSGESRELLSAHQTFLQSRRERAVNEQRAIHAETEWYQSRAAADLLEAQQEFASKSLALKIAELELFKSTLEKRRGDEVDRLIRQAETTLAKVAAEFKPIAEKSLEFANEQKQVTIKNRDINDEFEKSSAMLSELQKEFDRMQTMVKKVGLTDGIGLLLRQHRAKLPDMRATRASLAHRNDEVRETRMRQFQLDADRNALLDLDSVAARFASEHGAAKKQKSVAATARELFSEQRQLIKGLDAEYSRYFAELIELDNVERQLLKLTTTYSDYVDERVLWIRTGQSFGRSHLAGATSGLRWISDLSQWQLIIETWRTEALRHPLPWMLTVIPFAIWVCIGPLLLLMIRRRGEIASRPDCNHLWPTLQTIILTVILACGWPAIICFLGWRLDRSGSSVLFVQAVSDGLIRVATFMFPLEVLRIICTRDGLAERHFGWPSHLVNIWRTSLNWYLLVGAVSMGLIGTVEGTADEHRLDVSGRLTFLMFSVLSCVFCLMTFRQSRLNAQSQPHNPNESDVWANLFWRFVPRLALLTCLALFVLGWSGYLYTALQITWRLQKTAWLAIGLLLLRGTIRRWIALERRRMAALQDKELKTIAEAGRAPEHTGHSPFLFPRWNWPDFRLNLTQIVKQMQKLLDTTLVTMTIVGLWYVWADITPALNILDKIPLWETTVERSVIHDQPDGTKLAKMELQPKKVTAACVGVALLIVVVSIIAGRNVPGLVEVILLEHLSVDAGIRFATTCLVRYAIFTLGVTFAFAQIGIGWSSVQWLVAAASVGLGFGLQEIFGNFVSGIILLFERPMRVGDTVTIGDTTGTISRIRFRATTIVDGDRKELIVPNKEFITGKLLNWTLSDRVNRVAVRVVVSNDNDPGRIRQLLLEIASQQSQLLKDPAPSATLEEINGGLMFMLRGFLPTLEGRGNAIHDLYTKIHDRFQAEGIEMAYPSQEIFFRAERHEGHSSIPVNPHQAPAGAAVKSMSAEFTSTFRRA